MPFVTERWYLTLKEVMRSTNPWPNSTEDITFNPKETDNERYERL